MQVKKRTLKFLFLMLVIILSGYFLSHSFFSDGPIYKMNGNKIFYSQDREDVNLKHISSSENNSILINKISFPSRNFLNYNTTIYGLLFTQFSKKQLPGILVLPGGGVVKEALIPRAMFLAEQGYAVLVIDQRGIGETGGYYLNFEDDYKVFIQGKEPIQHLAVFDVLRSIDALRSLPQVKRDNIVLLGESMGGRYALIAASLDKKLNGIIVVSSSGLNLQLSKNDSLSNYLFSIDPDNYVSDISPTPLYMLQGTNDSVTPFLLAQNTFQKANEPKYFFTAEGCGHGYCDLMQDFLLNSLKSITS